jgi:hypothetical protein
MLTAKEFVLNQNDGYLAGDYTPNEVYRIMIGFAKMHVKAALKAADEKATVTVVDYEYELEPPTPIWGVDSSSILNAYPLNNIK